MNKLRLFSFGILIIIFESFIQSCITYGSLLMFDFDDFKLEGVVNLFAFFSLFVFYKLLFESWIFVAANIYLARREVFSKWIMIKSKLISSLILQIFVLGIAIDSFREEIGILALYAMTFAPSILIANFLIIQLWDRAQNWIRA